MQANQTPPQALAPGIACIGALYSSIERGLTADILTARALGAIPRPICTAHVAAGHGQVSDVLEVPSDTVQVHLDHLFATVPPAAAKVGVLGGAHAAKVVLRALSERLAGPWIWDLTLSGPNGEDLTPPRAVDAMLEHLGAPTLLTLRRCDATLLAGMEIHTLDDAQVALQRLAQRGARRILLRGGLLSGRFFDEQPVPADFRSELYYDGVAFSLFETPHQATVHNLHGASSLLTLSLVKGFLEGKAIEKILQSSIQFTSEAIRFSNFGKEEVLPNYFWKHNPGMT